MRNFVDAAGRVWVASAREENTPRHHGRWYLVFHTEDEPGTDHPMPEVRWQTAETARRTLLTMSEFELRRRLDNVLRRTARPHPAAPVDQA
jgi:hypothetical protein